MVDEPPHERCGADSSRDSAPKQQQIAVAVNTRNRAFEAREERRKEQHDKNILKWTRRTALAAIAYTVLTFILLLAAGYSAIQAWRAVDAANRSADAASTQAEISADMEKRSLRAYVSPHNEDLTVTITNTEVIVGIKMKNSGKTPAYNVSGGIFIAEAAGPNIPNENPDLSIPIGARGTVGPGATFVFRDSISPPDMSAVRNQHHAMIVGGRIEYDDTFGGHHFTNYRFVIVPKPPKTSSDAWGLQPTLNGNDGN